MDQQPDSTHTNEAIYAWLRQEFERELPLLSDRDLEIVAAEEDAQPLEAFIGALERKAEGA